MRSKQSSTGWLTLREYKPCKFWVLQIRKRHGRILNNEELSISSENKLVRGCKPVIIHLKIGLNHPVNNKINQLDRSKLYI